MGPTLSIFVYASAFPATALTPLILPLNPEVYKFHFSPVSVPRKFANDSEEELNIFKICVPLKSFPFNGILESVTETSEGISIFE